jgi:Predicted transcriptional regulator with C-terminal CBS domains
MAFVKMITGAQIRAARGMLGWSSAELAVRSDVSRRTVAKCESEDGLADVNVSTIKKIIAAFEAAGIEFTGAPDHRPGIVMKL